MKKLLPFLLLLFTIFNVQAQEIEIIEPCDINKFLTDDGYYYARGVGNGSNPELAKSIAFLGALVNISEHEYISTSSENDVYFIYSGSKHFAPTAMLNNSAEALHYTRNFSTYDYNAHYAHFVNWSWIMYASMCTDFEILCTEVLKDEYGEYKAYYVLRISKQKAKKLFDEFNDFVDG